MKRKIIINGQGYGFADVNLTISINGINIFQGTVPTLDEPVPPLPFNDHITGDIGQEIAYWEVDMDFVGSQNLEINVESGTFLMTGITATHSGKPNPTLTPREISSGETAWALSKEQINSAKINEVEVISNSGNDNLYSGQWIYRIRSGDQFTAVITVAKGLPLYPWSSTESYSPGAQVTSDGKIYIASQTPPPMGTPLSERRYWASLPYPVWDIETAYTSRQRVRHDTNGYTSMEEIPAGTPITDPRWVKHV